MQDDAAQEWKGKAEGVPRPPTPAEIDEVSGQQNLIADEWAPAPQPPAGAPRPATRGDDQSR